LISICDLARQYQTLKPEIDAAVLGALASGHYIMGPNVKALENEAATYLGIPHTIAVNSGTDALHLALRALEIGPGDEVITTAFTFAATSEAIGIVGAKPVLVDIDPSTFNLDPQQVAYMGDDIFDLPVMRYVGLGAAPADAYPMVKERADWVSESAGGRGAVRELIDLVVKARGEWDSVIKTYAGE
jgi:hypothetical protein